MARFSQGDGVRLALSNWVVGGDPGFDVFGMDVARYGEWTSLRYTNAKVRENYSRRFSIRFPNEELPAARPVQTTPLYDVMTRDNHAVMADTRLPHSRNSTMGQSYAGSALPLMPTRQMLCTMNPCGPVSVI